MYHIYGFSPSFNTTKVLYCAEELGIEYEYTSIDLSKGEHKSPEHLLRHPLGKTPALVHDDKHLFESNTLCRYLADVERSALYPQNDAYGRALVDQWMDFYAAHLGRWLGTLLFERVVRERFGMGEKNVDVEAEALGFVTEQLACVNTHLSQNAFMGGSDVSIADCVAYAYMETTKESGVSLADAPAVANWYANYASRDSVARVRERLTAS